jgi:hypothetical protein
MCSHSFIPIDSMSDSQHRYHCYQPFLVRWKRKRVLKTLRYRQCFFSVYFFFLSRIKSTFFSVSIPI